MIKCKFCGAENPDKTRFCSFCGGKAKITLKSAPKTYNLQKKRNPLKIWVLAWAIINIALGVFGLITILPFTASILGVVSVVLVILAQDCQDPQSEKTKIRIAVILNIIASAILVISFILLIAFIFNRFIIPTTVPQNSFDIERFMEIYPYLD